jgi:fumarate reductase subunit C
VENEDGKMKSAAAPTPYTLNHPRWYRKHVSTYWWLQRWEYLRFVLREISSVFVAIFVVEMLVQIYALSRGPETYTVFLNFLKNPLVIALNVISFFFVVFHSITWFNLSARAMSIRVGGRKVPGFMISGPNFVAWFVISAAIAWLLCEFEWIRH